jgi:regulator of sigma E protease
MMILLRDIAAYLFDLGVLVFFHELGHFAAARSQGVVVEVFSIGFGPALWSRRAKSGTVWQLSAIPLGGYVKMQGWGTEEAVDPQAPGSFSAASLGSRAFIVAAGPLANFVLAFVIFAGIFMVAGRMESPAVINSVVPGSAAALAHLQPGDQILSLNGNKISNFEELQSIIAPHPDTPMLVTVERHGAVVSDQVTIGHQVLDGQTLGLLGVGSEAAVLQHFGPIGAMGAAGQEIWMRTKMTANGLFDLVVYHQGAQNLSGPLRIASVSGKVAAAGLVPLITLIAILSVNLGLVNLVPIPILDGGHLLFYFGEWIYGKPIPRQAQDLGLRFGVALLLSLYAFTTVNDLSRLGAAQWMAHLFG